ncbi:hypothetical protein [Desulfosporosinus sp. OT]|nr:hypothetical protein [Desulfosporosinus sp. OT]EGW41391.1 hypothetical protein DOT_0643 [Desulfosporosinus sp. OT]
MPGSFRDKGRRNRFIKGVLKLLRDVLDEFMLTIDGLNNDFDAE